MIVRKFEREGSVVSFLFVIIDVIINIMFVVSILIVFVIIFIGKVMCEL